jgi:thioredoxin:protein disulfide reductase
MRISRFAPLLLRVTLSAGLAVGLAGLAGAKPWWMRGIESNESDFLPPDVAFHVMAANEGTALRIRWVIADGYYLYRQRMDIKAESPDLVLSAPPTYPRGVVKTDAYFGSQEIYRQQVEATVPYSRIDGGAHPLQIKVTYQGCADAGLCYPPTTKVIGPTGIASGAGSGTSVATIAGSRPHPWQRLAILGGIVAFFLAGLMLRKGRKLPLPAA